MNWVATWSDMQAVPKSTGVSAVKISSIYNMDSIFSSNQTWIKHGVLAKSPHLESVPMNKTSMAGSWNFSTGKSYEELFISMTSKSSWSETEVIAEQKRRLIKRISSPWLKTCRSRKIGSKYVLAKVGDFARTCKNHIYRTKSTELSR